MAGTLPTSNTQARLILDILRARPLCGAELYTQHGVTHRLAARIHDLRHRYGWDIDSEPCRLHAHDSLVYVYRLRNADQMELPL